MMKWAAVIIVFSLLATRIAVASESTTRPTTMPAMPATALPSARPVALASEIRFDGTPFTDAIDYLREITRANIFVNWRQLQADGIDPATPISLRVHNIRFGKLLQLVLDDVDPRLKYTAHEGVITIYLSQYVPDPAGKVTKVYDTTDLMFPIPELQDLYTGQGSQGSFGNNNTGGTSGNRRSGSSRNTSSSSIGGRNRY